jgi:hypothetical protein
MGAARGERHSRLGQFENHEDMALASGFFSFPLPLTSFLGFICLTVLLSSLLAAAAAAALSLKSTLDTHLLAATPFLLLFPLLPFFLLRF